MRIACLLVPDLPLAATLRAHPELEGRPVVLVSEPGPRGTLLAVSSSASRAGVLAGSTLAHARSLCGDLHARVASPALERAARRALLDVALSVSPRAELVPRGAGIHRGEATVHLDASGLASLFGSESGVATALVARAAVLGLPAVVGVAGSRAVAHLAARCLCGAPQTTRVLAPEAEPAFLAGLPLDLLDPSDALADALTRFGIHRLGALLALPRRALFTRLGPEVRDLVARLRGEEHEPPPSVPRVSRLEEELELEAPVERLEPLAFVLRGLLSRLLARLAVRRLACGELDLTLRTSNGSRETRRLGLAAPTLDPGVLLRRLRFGLEVAPPGDAVEAVALAAEGRSLRNDQLDLFRPAGPAPATLDALLAELEASCGAGRVGSPGVADDHRPDAFEMRAFAPEAVSRDTPAGPVAHPTLAVRALRPPVTARVRTRGGRPLHVRSAVANGAIVRCAGPWRTTGGWWSPEIRFAFDHFDVQTGDGLVVRLRHDRLQRAWLVDGVYD